MKAVRSAVLRQVTRAAVPAFRATATGCAVQLRTKATTAAAEKGMAKQTEAVKIPRAVHREIKAIRARVAKQKALLKARQQKAREEKKVAAAKARKEKEEKKKKAKVAEDVMQEKKVKQNQAKKAAMKASGPVTAFTLFVNKSVVMGRKASFTKAAAQWKAMSEEQKEPFRTEASKNLAKRNEIRQSFKKPPTKYALFTKENFPAAYAAALEETSDKKQAFKIATYAVAKKFKSQ